MSYKEYREQKLKGWNPNDQYSTEKKETEHNSPRVEEMKQPQDDLDVMPDLDQKFVMFNKKDHRNKSQVHRECVICLMDFEENS